jgi:EmrB/QacA subfamily drug resistance transporter
MKHSKKSPWLIFFLVALAQFMVVLDSSITNVALPAIKQTLHFSPSDLQWVVTAYALTFGGFLLLGGRAADILGRRNTLMVGMIAFTFFSLLIGLSKSSLMLIVLRAFQGAAAALMSPSALSIVLTTFPDGKDRNKALGYWTTVATGGAAVGLLLGGVLTQYFGWEWNFFINVPIGILISIAIPKILPKHEQEEGHKNMDLPGAALVTGGLILFVFAISQSTEWGLFSLGTLSTLSVAVLLLIAFIFNESRTKYPLMPLSIFKSRNVLGANLMMAPVMAGMFGMFYLTSLYTQTILHFSPIVTGFSFLPFPIILGIMSTQIGKLVSQYGYKRFLIAGPLIIAFSLALLTRLPSDGTYFINLLPTILLMPLGVGMTFMPIFAAATSGVPGYQSGLASGLINTSQQMGGALGLAILSGVAASVTGPTTAPGQLVHGYDSAFLVAVGFVLAATLLGLVIIKQQSRNHVSPATALTK